MFDWRLIGVKNVKSVVWAFAKKASVRQVLFFESNYLFNLSKHHLLFHSKMQFFILSVINSIFHSVFSICPSRFDFIIGNYQDHLSF